MDTSSPSRVSGLVEETEPTVSVEEREQREAEKLAARAKIEQEARQYLVDQTQAVTVPPYASWFDMQQIHNIERVSLPEFFTHHNLSKTALIYQDYRDFMINTYRLNPKEYLAVTACRRNLAGDVCAIMRVHAFLEQWGLINFECDPSTWPSPVGPPFTGHFRVTADTPRGLAPFKPNIKPQANPSTSLGGEMNVELRQKVFESSTGKDTKEYHCTTCGAECSRERYHSVKTKNMDLCSLCYKEGRFPMTSFSSDFIRYEPSAYKHGSEDERAWTDEETLLLLEAIELYDDDWNTIAEYVGTKTREQCIFYFLQLPIDEPYRETEHRMKHSSVLEHQRTPFSQADNPVMSILAFLASAVDPEVASAAADAAIACQEQSSKKRKEDTTTMEVEKSAKKPRTAIEKAASVALGSAAAKSKSLSLIEEKEIRRLVHSVVDTEVKKLELKMSYFDELEAVLENELDSITQQRKDIFAYRLSVKKSEALLQEEIMRRGGIEQAVESGWTPQELQQFVQGSLFKEDYHLVDISNSNQEGLVHPATVMDEGGKPPLAVLSL
ncbi:uncharacterized protein EV154DRAFT_424156 [Mucor mucedo]|uniref:uncharacterized protein n=1 Tax=Mucor mucedo TaxID=29922 RepID=UPI002220A991|nr:uncharacterized protein EV154DRAFT_424156 [Mucor mucedo]KAI7889324.1 hypothetical protein EV154DRAFT_424156 [Mucor mucedo]